MKKQRITYGVSGMMEYQAVIKVGRNNMKVNFSDGSVSAMGVNPATFTTENFMVQHAIENSSDYKRGRIKTVNVIELNEDLCIESNNAEVKAENAAVKTENETVEVSEAKAGSEDAGTETEPVEAEPAIEVECACNDDAKDYLEQSFGYVRSKLRNREDIINAGKAHNVTIIFV